MDITRRSLLGTVGGGLAAGAFGVPLAFADAKEPQVGIVVKIGGIPWFNAMEEGTRTKKTIFIGGISDEVDEGVLVETFATFGELAYTSQRFGVLMCLVV